MSETRTRYKPLAKTFTPAVMKAITDLAEKGLSRQAIIRNLGIDKMAFSRYKETTECFMLGRDKLAITTSANIIKASNTSFMDRKLLSEKLNLFQEPFTLKKSVKDPSTAKQAIAEAIGLYCEAKISESQMLNISRACAIFVELDSQTVLRKEIDEIKKLLKGKK
ncbi:hypothetical protein ACLHDG_06635 [Sulfurovum sp. CS9]|uniref:hypothetical protein n=1 Tax=Sulfurovum sp. CS9 TaxID=3391146 RepID=UPI0039ED2C94